MIPVVCSGRFDHHVEFIPIMKSATAISALFLLITLVLIAVYCRHFNKTELSFSDNFHLMVTPGFNHVPDARLALFNVAEYGPYRGSIIALDNGSHLQSAEFNGTLAIYFRHFRWPNGDVLWTLSVTLWYFVALFSILPGVWVVRRLRAHGFPLTRPFAASQPDNTE